MHYTYILTDDSSKMYIGKHSCNKKCTHKTNQPICDYMGSYKDKSYKPVTKQILDIYDSKQEALLGEVYLHDIFNVDVSELYANQAKQRTDKFSFGGKHSKKSKTKMSQSQLKHYKENPERKEACKSMLGKSHTEDTKNQIRESVLNSWTEERRKSYSKARQGRGNPNADTNLYVIRDTNTNQILCDIPSNLTRLTEVPKGALRRILTAPYTRTRRRYKNIEPMYCFLQAPSP